MWKQETRGKLRLYERYTDLDGNDHKISVPLASNSARDYKEAVSNLMLKIADQERGSDQIRLHSIIVKYLDRPDLKASTINNYQYLFGKIEAIFGNPYLSTMNNAMVKRKLSESDLSISRRNQAIKVIKSLQRYAVEYGYTSEVVSVRPFKGSQSRDNIEDKYLNADELQSVLNQLVAMDYYLAKFLALTGCRFGEAAALTLSDYDGKYISISKTMWHNAPQAAKTETSERQIYVQTELRKLLAEYLPFRNTLLMARGVRTDLLFFGKHGTPADNNLFNRHLQSIESNKPLHAHIFRHTHASLLAEAGYSLEAVSRRLGHSNSDITKKIYLHVTEKMKEREEAQLDRIRLID